MERADIAPDEGTLRKRWGYWPEIDGLRTIAVGSVVLFHFKRELLSGGFVGVDIFFVISGFLISSILLDDIAQGKFSIARFYQRRIARIFPAMILVICAVLLAGWSFYSAQDFSSLGINSAAAAASVINMKLIVQGSYFLISADAQPLLHYWSLAVEEQFYVVFPILLYCMVRFTRRPLTIALVVGAISFALCVWLTRTHPAFAFYALPSRAWELLAGASLALYRSRGGRVPDTLAPLIAWGGLALVAASVFLIREGIGFPGWVAALPVLGTVLLIAPVGDARPTPLKLLAQPWMVAIGKRSYSLYLWHWPVFSFVDYRFFAADEAFRAVLKIAITIILSELSYRYVEQTSRRYLNDPKRRRTVFAGAILAIGVIAALGIQIRRSQYFDVSPASIASGGMVVRGGDRAVVVLAGDSQAAMYGTEIAAIARARGFTLYALGTAGVAQLPGAPGSHWREAAAFIQATHPDLVIMADAWSAQLAGSAAPLRDALNDIRGSTARVLLLTQPPILPPGASREQIRGGARAPFREAEPVRRARVATTDLVRAFATDRVGVVDVAPTFGAPDGGILLINRDGRMNYHDPTHLSDRGTGLVHAQLDAAITGALPRR